MFVVVCFCCVFVIVCLVVFVVVSVVLFVVLFVKYVFVVVCCGSGPAGNTGRGWSRLRAGGEHWARMVVVEVRQGTGRGWSWLRSGGEHWAWMVVVEVRQGTLGVDGHG